MHNQALILVHPWWKHDNMTHTYLENFKEFQLLSFFFILFPMLHSLICIFLQSYRMLSVRAWKFSIGGEKNLKRQKYSCITYKRKKKILHWFYKNFKMLQGQSPTPRGSAIEYAYLSSSKQPALVLTKV